MTQSKVTPYPKMYEVSFDRTISSEGAFQDDPEDRGNWTSGKVGCGELKGTKYGIAAMSYPTLDIKSLTIAQVKDIYYHDWWLRCKLFRFRPAMQFQMFDAAMNHGLYRASQMIQRAAGAKDDGVIGPNTLRTVAGVDLNDLLLLFLAERLTFITNIKTFARYGKGWSRRIAHNLVAASKDN